MAAKPSRLSALNHAAGIYADMSVDGPAIGTLVAIIDRAKNLPNRKTMGKQNPYCAARLGKEAKKTGTDLRGGQTPKWDQELRFTVHESPDYLRMKVSIFNDDKKTDLIGETWVNLRDLIIPGGSQSDQWHPLQFRGKYAGEVRIEMTYYDTRPEDEAVIERRTQTAEKVQTKNNTPTPIVSSSSLSGPRQLKDVKRRPLPSGSNSSVSARPAPPEKTPSAPLPSNPPPRPTHHEHTHSTPSPNVGNDYTRHPPRQAALQEVPYDTTAYGSSSQVTPPTRVYETPDDFQREWNHTAPVAQPAALAPVLSKRLPQEQNHPSYREMPDEAYESRSQRTRSHPGYDNVPSPDYRSSKQDIQANRPDYQHPQVADVPARMPYEASSRPTSHQGNQPFPPTDQDVYEGDAMAYGHQVSRYSPRSSGRTYEHPPALEYAHGHPGSSGVEPDHHYRLHTNALVTSSGPHRNSIAYEDFHPEYATMQPRVDDDEDEEDGPPPPPPAHRSGLGQPSHQLVPSPASSYKAYSPDFRPSPRDYNDMTMVQPSHMQMDRRRSQDLRQMKNPSMPPSLVAGFDATSADPKADRASYERPVSRRRSFVHEEQATLSHSPEPEPMAVAPPYPVDPPPQPLDHRRSLVSSRGSASSDTRIVPRRKSVSPQPPSVVERRASQNPFSPDSYDILNPNAARSAVINDPAPPYETPSQAMDAALRNEMRIDTSGPIIGDDGREIDPSDHLPADTWAPEPERKNKKPEIIVRFKNAPARTNVIATHSSSRDSGGQPRAGVRPPVASARRPQSYVQTGPDSMDYMDRGRHENGSYGHGRNYSTSNATPQRISPRKSVSPSPTAHSPSSLYAPTNSGPPLPAKVPVAQPVSQSYPVMGVNPGMDALSRELNTIDIGSVRYDTGRAMRKYVPKTISTGYAM